MKVINKALLITGLSIILFGCAKKEYKKDKNTLYFGLYPKTLVNDESLIETLNKKISIPSSSNLNGWNDYNYYIETNITSYMYYIDIDNNNDNIYDYRGVYFNQYRPNNTMANSNIDRSYQDDNNYFIDNIYWFKYEKIKWEILENKNDSYLIVTKDIIDSQDYYSDATSGVTEHNGGSGYGNNYKLSNIRKWLNDSFYNWAFNDKEKEIILTTEVDNSKESTSWMNNDYACENTFDNIFLLSHHEAIDIYYPVQENRKYKGTDYAKCQGLLVASNGYSCWRLRSPYTNFETRDTHLDHNGQRFNQGVINTGYGIRPALWIKK